MRVRVPPYFPAEGKVSPPVAPARNQRASGPSAPCRAYPPEPCARAGVKQWLTRVQVQKGGGRSRGRRDIQQCRRSGCGPRDGWCGRELGQLAAADRRAGPISAEKWCSLVCQRPRSLGTGSGRHWPAAPPLRPQVGTEGPVPGAPHGPWPMAHGSLHLTPHSSLKPRQVGSWTRPDVRASLATTICRRTERRGRLKAAPPDRPSSLVGEADLEEPLSAHTVGLGLEPLLSGGRNRGDASAIPEAVGRGPWGVLRGY